MTDIRRLCEDSFVRVVTTRGSVDRDDGWRDILGRDVIGRRIRSDAELGREFEIGPPPALAGPSAELDAQEAATCGEDIAVMGQPGSRC